MPYESCRSGVYGYRKYISAVNVLKSDVFFLLTMHPFYPTNPFVQYIYKNT